MRDYILQSIFILFNGLHGKKGYAYDYTSIIFFRWKGFVFPVVPFLMMLLPEILVFVCLNIYFSYKSCKNLSRITNLEYIFDVNNLGMCVKNSNRIFGTFYRVTSKS